MKRTLENCALVKRMGVRPNQYGKVCEGFGKKQDDEPCEICKNCKLLHTREDVTEMRSR